MKNTICHVVSFLACIVLSFLRTSQVSVKAGNSGMPQSHVQRREIAHHEPPRLRQALSYRRIPSSEALEQPSNPESCVIQVMEAWTSSHKSLLVLALDDGLSVQVRHRNLNLLAQQCKTPWCIPKFETLLFLKGRPKISLVIAVPAYNNTRADMSTTCLPAPRAHQFWNAISVLALHLRQSARR